MKFWTWLTGKSDDVAIVDKVWLNKPAKYRAMCGQAEDQLCRAKLVLLLAHFPATLTEVGEELARSGVPHQVTPHPISANEVKRLAETPMNDRAYVGLVEQIHSDPVGDREADREPSVQILVAERHFRRENDDLINDFARSLTLRSQITFYLSLEDPLMKAIAGDWVGGMLQRLGMDESKPIESPLVARRVHGAQAKFAKQLDNAGDARSAEEWLQANGSA
jgi:preprotein translocase subunit SecA